MPAESILALAAVAAVLAAWAVGWASWRRTERAAPAQIRRIRIDGDYQPAEVHLRAGEPARLIFRREETAACSERVVFPDYGISVMLPPHQDIAIDLPASSPGEHEFTCQMQTLHGRLIFDHQEVAS
jgi:plastocyanin domain-containing protein